MKTGNLEIDTPLLPSVIAQLLTDDPGLIRALSARAKRHYKQGGLFARRMESAKGRRWCHLYMLHWLDSYKADPSRYRDVHAADFQTKDTEYP